MTAVMRALAPPLAPRVLRIGLVVGGRIIEERIIKQRTHVTVGGSAGCTFVVPIDLPVPFKLFELVDGFYELHVLGGMSGRIALASGVADLADLRARARAGTSCSVRLDESARGKIALGSVAFLFQFVAPLPLQPRPRLPLSVRADLASQIDWRFTGIAAFSFLVHFGVVGAMYSDWSDPVIDEDLTAGLLPMIQSTAPDAPPPEPREDPDPSTAAGGEPAPAPAPQPHSGSGRSARPPQPDPGAVDDLVGAAERTRIDILLALDPGRSLRSASSPQSEGPPVNLDALATRAGGVDNGDAARLGLPREAGPLGPRGDLRDLRPVLDSPVGSTAGPPRAVVPRFEVEFTPPPRSVPVANAEATIRSQIHPGARHCYQKGLESDPSQAGRLVLQIHIAPSGEVDRATATTSTGLSASVVRCIERAAGRARFDAPGPSGSTLSLPFNFVRQGG
jgi:hypothetical protein